MGTVFLTSWDGCKDNWEMFEQVVRGILTLSPPFTSEIKLLPWGNSLVVQWLGLLALQCRERRFHHWLGNQDPKTSQKPKSSSAQRTITGISPPVLHLSYQAKWNTQIEELDFLYNKILPQPNNLEVFRTHCKEISPKKVSQVAQKGIKKRLVVLTLHIIPI